MLESPGLFGYAFSNRLAKPGIGDDLCGNLWWQLRNSVRQASDYELPCVEERSMRRRCVSPGSRYGMGRAKTTGFRRFELLEQLSSKGV
jgi:hypothetical protein